MSKNHKIKITLENFAIYITVLVSVLMFFSSLVYIPRLEQVVFNHLEMNRMVQRLLAIAILIVALNLHRRKRMAWIITVLALAISTGTHIFKISVGASIFFLIVKIILLGVFLLTKDDFCCFSDKRSTRIGAVWGGVGLVAILSNIIFAYWMLHQHAGLPITGWQSVQFAITNLFTNEYPLGVVGEGFAHVENFAFWMTWLSILLALLFIVRPFIFKKVATDEELEKARVLINQYGQNCSAYLSLERDKTLYFGEKVEGLVAYGTVGQTMVVHADPICKPEDFESLLKEFTAFARKTAHDLFYMGLSDRFIEEYKKLGYGTIKCGEEARFDLQEYNIAGKKGQKMRMNVNHAKKAGLEVVEYKVLEARNPALDKEFDRITKEWLEDKKSSELEFSVGGVGLETPRDKRYFYAIDEEKKIQGFVVFCPFVDEGKGYLADVTRRATDSPSGITELIIYEAFQVFKEEGVKWGSMGAAPLANVVEEGVAPTLLEKVLSFAYENLNNIYGFKSLHHAKEKYSPTYWRGTYFAYLPKHPKVSMFYAVIRIQNPKGIWDYVKSFFKNSYEDKKLQREAQKLSRELAKEHGDNIG